MSLVTLSSIKKCEKTVMKELNINDVVEQIHSDFIFKKLSTYKSDFRVLSTDIQEKPIPVIEIYDKAKETWDPMATLGNISTVKGKAKSRKSTFLSLVVAAGIKGQDIEDKIRCTLPADKDKILYIDTEQQKYHVSFIHYRVKSLSLIDNTDENLFVYSLRSLSPKERVLKVRELLSSIEGLGLIIIDGIRDLVMSINDEVESTEIVSLLMKWSLEYDVHIMNVLHENPTSDKARGHIGTEMMNKSETVIKVEIDSKEDDISVIYPDMCRNKPFSAFPIGINDSGIPYVSDKEISKAKQRKMGIKDLDGNMISLLIDQVFKNNKELTYESLATQIQTAFKFMYGNDIGKNQAKDLIKKLKEDKTLQQPEGKNKPYTQYRLEY